MRRTVHMICHAHLDPVWLWTRDDGLSAAMSTFWSAIEFCDKHAGFVFNQNESLLYEWALEHDPRLFAAIEAMVRQGRWEPAGGSYLQPDLNGPGGESLIRHHLLGLAAFAAWFGARPRVAYNFDAFGHPEGLPQLLAGCGMRGYLFCRPEWGTADLPKGNFHWTDRSGASILTRRSDEHYPSHPGHDEQDVRSKAAFVADHYADESHSVLLWGVGNHGGGASRLELERLEAFARSRPDLDMVHSTPDRFFEACQAEDRATVTRRGEIQEVFPGCYTAMSRVKRLHRRLEGELQALERLAAFDSWRRGRDYPRHPLDALWRQLLFHQFHDILPGTCTPDGEAEAIEAMGGALESIRRLRLAVVLDRVCGLAAAAEGEVPLFLTNPHPAHFDGTVELNYTVAHSWVQGKAIELRRKGRRVAFQRVAAGHNLNNLWTVRLLIHARLGPFETIRLDASLVSERTSTPATPRPKDLTIRQERHAIHVGTSRRVLRINRRTGLIDLLSDGPGSASALARGAMRPVLFVDADHTWTCGDVAEARKRPDSEAARLMGFRGLPWRRASERFRLASSDEVSAFWPAPPLSGSTAPPSGVRLVEQGPLRVVIEAAMVCGPSRLLRRYLFEVKTGRVVIEDDLLMAHRDRAFMYEAPLGFETEGSRGESLYSATERAPTQAIEPRTHQRWVSVHGKDANGPAGQGASIAFVSGDVHAHALTSRAAYLSVLRTPAYASFGIKADDPLNHGQHRARQDQGQHRLAVMMPGHNERDEASLRRLADAWIAPPRALAWFPRPDHSEGEPLLDMKSQLDVRPASVVVAAVKQAHRGNGLVVRLLNTAHAAQSVRLRVAGRDAWQGRIGGYALTTLRLNREPDGQQRVEETSLVEGL